MKQATLTKIDTQGLQKAVTMLAVAGGLAGWAVLARPEQPMASTTTAVAAGAQVTSSAPAAAAPVIAAPAAAAPVVLPNTAPASTSALRVVTAPPAPVTITQSSR